MIRPCDATLCSQQQLTSLLWGNMSNVQGNCICFHVYHSAIFQKGTDATSDSVCNIVMHEIAGGIAWRSWSETCITGVKLRVGEHCCCVYESCCTVYSSGGAGAGYLVCLCFGPRLELSSALPTPRLIDLFITVLLFSSLGYTWRVENAKRSISLRGRSF